MKVAAKLQPELPGSWPDERLVSECRKGNQVAWSALIEKYKNLIYSIPVKLGLYEDAADIFQGVCLDLLIELPRLREPKALPKWLMQTCYHKCLWQQRAAARHVPMGRDESGQEIAVPDEQIVIPEDFVARLEEEQMVRDALAEIGSRCERLMRMLFYETPARPYAEVARDLNLATGSIGFIRGRCLSKLKKQLEKMGF